MKRIAQQHKTGCGIACIAMITGLTYRQVLKFVYPHRWFWQKVEPLELGPILWSLDLEYCEVLGKQLWSPQTTYPAILIIGESNYQTHAIVWDPTTQSILDPYRKTAYPTEEYLKYLLGYYSIVGKRKISNEKEETQNSQTGQENQPSQTH